MTSPSRSTRTRAVGYGIVALGYLTLVVVWVVLALGLTITLGFTFLRFFISRPIGHIEAAILTTAGGGFVFWGTGLLAIYPGSYVASLGARMIDPDGERGFGLLASKPFVRGNGAVETGTRWYVSEEGLRRLRDEARRITSTTGT
jgi:hypothetical protein